MDATREQKIQRWIAAGYSRQQAELTVNALGAVTNAAAPGTVPITLGQNMKPAPPPAAKKQTHRPECGDVGDVGEVGDLGSNAK